MLGTRTLVSPLEVYRILITAYGRHRWWTDKTPFEVMVAAVLSLGTQQKSTEQALKSLQKRNLLDCDKIVAMDVDALARIIRVVASPKQKAERLIALVDFYMRHEREKGMKRWPVTSLRLRLLNVKGLDPETVDLILLYALDKPLFVVDKHIKRVFSRIGQIDINADYHDLQKHLMNCLPHDLSVFKELQALVTEHVTHYCQVTPDCQACPLLQGCNHGEKAMTDALIHHANNDAISGVRS